MQKRSSLLTTSLLLVVCSYQFFSISCNTPPIEKSTELSKPRPKQKHYTGKQIVVAVIDTGIDPNLLSGNSYCKEGHKDFTGEGIRDLHGHGTHISGLIDQYAKGYVYLEHVHGKDTNLLEIDDIKVNYCQIILKYYSEAQDGMENLQHTLDSLRWAIDHEVDIINYSGGGTIRSPEENALIVEALDKGIKVVAAAGNEHSNSDFFHFYPANYDERIYVVGNWTKSREPAKTSNYGNSVRYWEIGVDVLSRLPNGQYGYMTGTSQSTAIKSGKLVNEMMTYE